MLFVDDLNIREGLCHGGSFDLIVMILPYLISQFLESMDSQILFQNLRRRIALTEPTGQ